MQVRSEMAGPEKQGACEVAQHQSDLRFRSLIETSMDAVLLTGPDGRIVMANGASARLFGYTEEELCKLGGQAVIGLSDPADPALETARAERQRTGRFRGELTMNNKAGDRFPVEISSASFRDEQGVEWISLFIRDISERKAREAERERLLVELDAKQTWLRAVLENVPLGVIIFGPDKTVSANRRAEQLFGMQIAPGGGSAQYAARVLHPDGTPVPPERLVSSRVLHGGETVQQEQFLIEHPPGVRTPMLGSAAPIRSSDGKILGGIGVFQEVTEMVKAQESIRASERLLNGIFEILPVGLWVADPTGRTVRQNPAGACIWGGTVEDGAPIAPAGGALSRALVQGETALGEQVRIECLDGTRKVILNSAMPLCDEHGQRAGAVLVSQDITPLKETEEQLRQALRLHGEFLSIVAHDLRNPLSSIGLRAQSLLRAIPDEQQCKQLKAIESSAQQMNALIQDLLDLARLEAGRLPLVRRATEVAPLIDHVLEVYRPLLAEARLAVGLQLGAGLPRIDVDPGRLSQVLANLLGNALKFTPPKGSVQIEVVAHEGEVRFSVADTGPGIPEPQRAHVFEQFWQADRKDRRGAGLGLAICKGIVEAHGGRIWVESEPGRGSTFRFTVPAARACGRIGP